jgi:6,7-dimethyl-8-ribityllumazine synthase
MSKVLILEARFYNHIADGLLAGATAALADAGYGHDVILLPGIYELPAALALAVEAGKTGNGPHYAGFITLGCAIRGESDHYHFICGECMRGLGDLAVTHHLALGNGVLTVHNEAQALRRSDPAQKNFGGQAARAALRMIEVKQQLGISA